MYIRTNILFHILSHELYRMLQDGPERKAGYFSLRSHESNCFLVKDSSLLEADKALLDMHLHPMLMGNELFLVQGEPTFYAERISFYWKSMGYQVQVFSRRLQFLYPELCVHRAIVHDIESILIAYHIKPIPFIKEQDRDMFIAEQGKSV